ncbi:MAG: AMIN domain-containing protein, partial [Terriglobales bacterium]
MRIASAVALMFVLLGWGAIPTICQDTDIRGARAHSTITSVAVVEGADIIDVEVTFSELVQPAVRRLEHPDRLVFDFPGCDLAEMGQRFVVNRGSVMTVSTEAFGVARPGARVVIDLRTADLGSADLGSAQNRGRADSGNKLVVNLSAIGNKLIIELSTIELSSSHLSSTGGAGRPALGSGGNKPAANSQPLATASDRGTGPAVSKTAEVVPPMLNLPHIALQSDRVALKSVEVAPPMPNLPAVLGRDQVVLESAEVVAPMPTVPPPVPRSDRVVLRSPETAAPMPSVPPVLQSNRGAFESAEIVPPMPSLPPFLQSDRVVLPQSAEVVPPMQNVPSFDLR